MNQIMRGIPIEYNKFDASRVIPSTQPTSSISDLVMLDKKYVMATPVYHYDNGVGPILFDSGAMDDVFLDRVSTKYGETYIKIRFSNSDNRLRNIINDIDKLFCWNNDIKSKYLIDLKDQDGNVHWAQKLSIRENDYDDQDCYEYCKFKIMEKTIVELDGKIYKLDSKSVVDLKDCTMRIIFGLDYIDTNIYAYYGPEFKFSYVIQSMIFTSNHSTECTTTNYQGDGVVDDDTLFAIEI